MNGLWVTEDPDASLAEDPKETAHVAAINRWLRRKQRQEERRLRKQELRLQAELRRQAAARPKLKTVAKDFAQLGVALATVLPETPRAMPPTAPSAEPTESPFAPLARMSVDDGAVDITDLPKRDWWDVRDRALVELPVTEAREVEYAIRIKEPALETLSAKLETFRARLIRSETELREGRSRADACANTLDFLAERDPQAHTALKRAIWGGCMESMLVEAIGWLRKQTSRIEGRIADRRAASGELAKAPEDEQPQPSARVAC